MAPAVLGIAMPLNEALLLETIEHPDQLTTVEAKGIGDGRLGVLGPLVEQREDAQVVHAGSRPLEGPKGVGLGAGAEVSEEESGTVEQLRGLPANVILSSHESSVTEE